MKSAPCTIKRSHAPIGASQPARQCTKLNLSNVARNGAWWCAGACNGYASGPTESSVGEQVQVCADCGSRNTLRWHPPTMQDAPEAQP